MTTKHVISPDRMFDLSRLLITVLLLFALFVPGVHAVTPKRIAPDSGPETAQGSAYNLPIGGGHSEQEVIDHALTMPGVLAAIDLAQSRGYLRHPEADRASFHQNPAGTSVFLALEKPDLVPPAGHIGAPLISITSIAQTGEVTTTILGSLIFVDTATGIISSADSFAGYGQDGSFATLLDSRSGGGGTGLRLPPGMPGMLSSSTPSQAQVKRCAIDYFFCMAPTSALCFAAAATVTVPWVAITIGFACTTHIVGCAMGFRDCLN